MSNKHFVYLQNLSNSNEKLKAILIKYLTYKITMD